MYVPLTRRAFLSDATLASAASAMKLPSFEHAQPPASEYTSRRNNFDNAWKFMQAEISGAEAPAFNDSSWQTLNVPHDWSIAGAFREDAAAAGTGAYLPTGHGWYRKVFTLPESARGKQAWIEFDGVYQRSEVFLNGVSLGMRPYGFISFGYDLTPHLNAPGKPNVLAVRVDNSLQPNCRWYSGSGIYRHVWLRLTDAVHIAPWSTCARAQSITPTSAQIELSSRVLNRLTHDAACEITFEILDPHGTVVAHQSATHSVPASGEQTLSLTLPVATPQLWSPETPVLYQARLSVRSGGKLLDQELTPFGIREAHFDAQRGFMLNGKRIKLNGVCIHGDAGAVGTAVPESMWERRLTLLRQMGCNAIRLSHNPPAPELLDMLDRMGFLVMAEAFDEWRQPKAQTPRYGYHMYFDEWHERDLTAMIERDRNHPSIVIWSAGNEVPDQTIPAGVETLDALLKIFRRLDPARPVTVACDNIAAEPTPTRPEFLAKLDVVGYNYVDRWRDRREKMYSIDHVAHPEWKLIGTESSALYGARGVYAADQTNSLFFERASNTLIEVEQQQKFIQTYDYVSGDFLWTGIDYLGESRWPSKLAATGVLDTCGFVKDPYFLFQSLWSKTPVLHLATHWNWAGKEGQMISVTCFTNCDTVELFLNGRSMGVKGYAFPRPGMIHQYGDYPPRAKAIQTTADLHLSWDVPYEAGTLKAVGSRNGAVSQTYEVQTAGSPARLALSADHTTIGRTPGEVAHVTVQVLDAQGRVVPTADNAVNFTLRGQGRILGVDNGQPDSHESFVANTRRAFNGLALVILAPTDRPGTMELTASAATLAQAQISLRVS